ncbi:MAG: DUF2807 domain-containing protein [Bacteroidales bacterium]|jgi:hypothetical protein|nr:DUF2807 domain-containing protein [Bacteroidales bacterium]
MKKIAILTFMLVAILTANAENIIKKNFTISDIKELEVSNNFTVRLYQGETESLTIQAEENMMDYVMVNIVDNKLNISLAKNVPNDSRFFYVDLTVKNLDIIKLSGSCLLVTRNQVNFPEIALNISENAQVNLKLKSINTHINTSGNNTCEFEGDVENCEIITSGNAVIKAEKFIINNINIEASGSSIANLNVINTANTKKLDSSKITFLQNPKIVTGNSY